MPKLHMTDIVVSRLKDCGTYYDQTTPALGLRVDKIARRGSYSWMPAAIRSIASG